MADGYHHGNLRAAVLEKAAEVIGREGPHSFSLRSLAVELGVSHTAPRHHFGSREGVLNALATEGFRELADRLRANREAGGDFLDAGVEYVRFATDRPAHFDVMFTPSLLGTDDEELNAARKAAFDELRTGVDSLTDRGEVEDAAAALVAGWSVVHGVATLALTGNLDGSGLRSLFQDTDLLAITRRSAGLLFGPRTPGSPRGD
ncbi:MULTISPECIES: TetR/AcrR family transcriptional regulator [Nocardiopsis]|uniref:AcrR family transcriptional regulator n=1 Tax=Nocardiopsis sinuspersici TaxID=501010 RepID=A0A1V3C486_9ACTN|nr:MULTISPECIES: TetR/AcrR family transcriptional regulator [Nocardiopsis]NYH52061.1 AcrR family transcriptional regulator [Nocardiopsis sinuspersici]OOC55604.1 TetR family transcriptional regulator [Nocardiopsis sinuspersici]